MAAPGGAVDPAAPTAPVVVAPISPAQRPAEQQPIGHPLASEEPGGALIHRTAEQPAVTDATFDDESLEPAVDPFVDEYEGDEYDGAEYDVEEDDAADDGSGRPSSPRENP
jgi:hypothetical protein